MRQIDPRFEFKEYTYPEVQSWVEALDKLYDHDTMTLVRQLSEEEQAFVRHEINRCKVDFNYWCRRYAKIKDKNMDLITLTPTKVQELVLSRIADAEIEAITGKSGDGVLLACLKARQLGISTLSDMILTHRTNFFANTTALIAADSDDRTPNLFEMVVRCYDNLPWWMQAKSSDPKRDTRVKNKYLTFYDQDSVIRFGSSANTQGGSSGEQKGSIGTGFTLPLCHLSELALWKNPSQISDALLPSIPLSPRTFVLFESTAKGIDNWWFDLWQNAKKGIGRLKPVFIPWYTDPTSYKLPAPVDWTPGEAATLHAERVRLTSHKWVGHTVQLTRDQLFWWEKTRIEYESRRELYKFLAEYTSDDEEAFQATMGGPFPAELIDHMRQRTQFPIYIDMGAASRLGINVRQR